MAAGAEEQERSAVGLAVGRYWSCRSFARPGATLLAPYSLPVFCLIILLIYSALFQFFSRHRKPANNNGKWLDIVPLAAVNSRSPILLAVARALCGASQACAPVSPSQGSTKLIVGSSSPPSIVRILTQLVVIVLLINCLL